MEEAKPISSVFSFDENSLGETMGSAAKAYHAVFDALPNDKHLVVQQMCRMFTQAAAAYSALFKFKGDMRTDVQRVCQVAGHALQFMVHMQNLRELFKKDDDYIHKVVDKTSEWLKSKGWFGLPTPRDENGVVVYKTAYGVYNDMKSYIDTYKKAMYQLCMVEPKGRR